MQPDGELQRGTKWHPAAIDNLVTAEPAPQIFPDRQVSDPKSRKRNPNAALSSSSSNGVLALLFTKVHAVFMQTCIPPESPLWDTGSDPSLMKMTFGYLVSRNAMRRWCLKTLQNSTWLRPPCMILCYFEQSKAKGTQALFTPSITPSTHIRV